MAIAVLFLSAILFGCADSKSGSTPEHSVAKATPPSEEVTIVALTEINRNNYEEVISAIWRTKFGQVVKTYLNSRTLSELNLRAEQVSNYIFKQDHKMITRLSALQLLKRDIVERGTG